MAAIGEQVLESLLLICDAQLVVPLAVFSTPFGDCLSAHNRGRTGLDDRAVYAYTVLTNDGIPVL